MGFSPPKDYFPRKGKFFCQLCGQPAELPGFPHKVKDFTGDFEMEIKICQNCHDRLIGIAY